ncbi:MAG: ABC transporter ATP-binding protein [Candidatus Hodarchaeales archaeon]|jgi:putative ABC transport system ATP-binding protein
MASTSEMAIQLKDVWKTYHLKGEDIHALRGLSQDIKRGEYRVIMGPSGSGKTTLLNIVGALDTPTKGEVFINDESLAGMRSKDLASVRAYQIGFIFQSFNLIPVLTALDNVMIPLIFKGVPLEERKRRGEDILNRVGLEGRFDHKPNELSGGQQQRVAIARALANEPTILLADEPTANLDLNTGFQIVELLRDLNEETGVTVINTTHDLKLIDIADKVSWLRDGDITQTQKRMKVEVTSEEIQIVVDL